MKKLSIALIVFSSLSSCGDSALDSCIDSKVEEGMSASEARKECEEQRSDAKIRR